MVTNKSFNKEFATYINDDSTIKELLQLYNDSVYLLNSFNTISNDEYTILHCLNLFDGYLDKFNTYIKKTKEAIWLSSNLDCIDISVPTEFTESLMNIVINSNKMRQRMTNYYEIAGIVRVIVSELMTAIESYTKKFDLKYNEDKMSKILVLRENININRSKKRKIPKSKKNSSNDKFQKIRIPFEIIVRESIKLEKKKKLAAGARSGSNDNE